MIFSYDVGCIALNAIKNWVERFFNDDPSIEDKTGPE
jgi:hypothetical protein